MRIVHDHNPGAYAVRVPCLTCGTMYRLADMAIDLDGPAFRAYYCRDHAPGACIGHRSTCDCATCVDARYRAARRENEA